MTEVKLLTVRAIESILEEYAKLHREVMDEIKHRGTWEIAHEILRLRNANASLRARIIELEKPSERW